MKCPTCEGKGAWEDSGGNVLPTPDIKFWLKRADTYMANNSLKIIQTQAEWIKGDGWKEAT